MNFNLRALLPLVACCLLATILSAQEAPPIYVEVEVQLPTTQAAEYLESLELDTDHFHPHVGLNKLVIPETDIPKLQASVLDYEVTVKDMAFFIEQRNLLDMAKYNPNAPDQKSATAGFELGSMGGFYTFDELIAQLDEMRSLYPSLITEKFSIGTTAQGRTIWAVKISDNPSVDESSSEAVFYVDALHHAREPASGATVINYMFHLLENYGSDPELTYLVNNREIYFVPCVNPDGYVYNEQTNPNGGGFWRKNRRVNSGSSCRGVDINRNYDTDWGGSGSSSNPCSDSYRGPSVFSELESQAVRDFVNAVQPSIAYTTHTSGGYWLGPDFSNGQQEFAIHAEVMAEAMSINEYIHGDADVILGYASGTTQNWIYEATGALTWTPEIGETGFWPSIPEIIPLVNEQLLAYEHATWVAGAYADFQGFQVLNGSSLSSADNLELGVEIFNKGLSRTANNVQVTLTTDNPGVTAVVGSQSYGNIASRAKVSNSTPFEFSVGAGVPAGTVVTFFVEVTQDGVTSNSDSFSVTVGERNVLFSDDAEGGNGNWVNQGSGTTWQASNEDTYTGNNCFVDSRLSHTSSSQNRAFAMNSSVSLAGTSNPRLEFAAKWQGHRTTDYIRLQISTNGGSSWSTIGTNSTSDISGSPAFRENENWTWQDVDLSAYAGQSVRFRFWSISSGGLRPDGFYFDAFRIVDYSTPPACAVSGSIVNENCDGQGTVNTADDVYTITVTATVTNGSGAYDLLVNGSQVAANRPSGSNTSFTRPADGNTVNISFRDASDNSCVSGTITSSPLVTCSPPPPTCEVTGSITNESCDGQGTVNTSDDIYIISVSAMVTNGSGAYDVLVDGTEVQGNVASGTGTSFTLPASGTTANVTFRDATDNGCVSATSTTSVLSTCSPPPPVCSVTGSIMNESCDGQGTVNTADDVYTITVSATVANGSGAYDVLVDGTEVQANVTSGTSTSFTLPASGTTAEVTFRDATDNGCVSGTSTTSILSTCSPPPPCVVSGFIVNEICDGQNTAATGDDIYTITVNATVANGSGAYDVLVDGSQVVANVSSGSNTSFTVPASGSSVAVTFRDASDNGCVSSAVNSSTLVSCSPSCSDGIQNGQETGVDCGGPECSACPTVGFQFERGTVTASNGWISVPLSNSYNSMVVVATPVLPNNSTTPVVTRVRNASGSSFELRVQNPSNASIGSYLVHYVVVEEGVYTVANDGIKLEAVKTVESVTSRKNGWSLQSKSYQQSYSSPVVLGQVMTANDNDWSVFWAASGSSRTTPPTSSSFSAGKHVGEDSDITRASETIGYIVIEAGTGTIQGTEYIAGVGSDIVRGPSNSSNGYTYGLSGLSTTSAAVASVAALDGGDGGWPVLFGGNPFTSSSLTLSFDEDQIADSERSHTTEQVAIWAFGTTAGPPACTVSGSIVSESCDGQGTVNTADDTYDITVTATVSNGSGAYDVLVDGNEVAANRPSGSNATITVSADGGTVDISFRDAADNSCVSGTITSSTLSTCSPPPCSITGNIDSEDCDGQGTVDTADDIYTITVSATVSNGSGAYDVLVDGSEVVANVASGTSTNITLPASSTTADITFRDASNDGCVSGTSTTSVLSTCSPPPPTCDVSGSIISESCNGQNTVSTADDVYTITVIATVANGSGSYDVLVNGAQVVGGVASGTSTNFTTAASGGAVAISFRDAIDGSCVSSIITSSPLSSCSPTCGDGIQNGQETGVDCGGPDCAACPTCDDGIQNGNETGVDCGGPDCAACPISYCGSQGNSTNYEFIQSVTFNGQTNNSGNNGGYADFTSIIFNADRGESVPISLTPGFNGSSYNEFWTVFIDYNADGDFSDNGEVVFQSAGSNTRTGNILIPSGAVLGNTRVRISMQWNAYVGSSCGSFTYGEVEDYTINISSSGARLEREENSFLDAYADDGPPVLELFPNPAQESINLKVNGNFQSVDNVSIDIVGADGRLVKHLEQTSFFRGDQLNIDLSNLKAGVYIMLIKGDGYQESLRFIRRQ
ncbi:M14 family zinc carboxypeptidase [Lewinella sp. W8]|uniref:M14 family zinc carboxypeptidase n=1 Tax=Lewinella sp. W8 TaxID=2528208 RepID=UPI0010673324|nr:M14 family zinc carboxypeptidase [Lewinella sp. W8]MTB50237.1 T9SS type A sorting domain-containing protein [Lewinella sp. W8]